MISGEADNDIRSAMGTTRSIPGQSIQTSRSQMASTGVEYGSPSITELSSSSGLSPISHCKTLEEEMDEISCISDSADSTVSKDISSFNHREELKEIATRGSQGIVDSFAIGSAVERKPLLTSFCEVEHDDPVLNPNNPSFDVYKWAKKTLSALESSNVKVRRLSYAFKNLTVMGSSSASNTQATVGSAFMLPYRLRGLFSDRKSKNSTAPYPRMKASKINGAM